MLNKGYGGSGGERGKHQKDSFGKNRKLRKQGGLTKKRKREKKNVPTLAAQ